MSKVQLSYIFVLIGSVFSYGQVFLSTEVSSKEATTNEVISLTIVMEISGEESFQESPLRLPDLSKFDNVGGGSEQNTFIDPIKKVRINQLIYQILLLPKQAGVVKIGSALVEVNGKTHKTEPFDIVVRDGGKRHVDNAAVVNNPIYLNVKLADKEVYKNEPVVAILRAFTKDIDNFRKIKSIASPKHNNLLIQAVNYKKSDIEPEGRPGMLSQIIGVFVIFPKEDGMVEVPPFSAELSDSKTPKITSNKTTFHVKKLPAGAPEDYNEFVGDFSIQMTNVESIPQPIEINKPIEVVLKLVGKGNLSAINMPKIKSSKDYDFFPPKLVKSLKTEKDGVVGFIEAHYIVVPKKAGNIEIKAENMSFFNPEKKAYFDLGEKNIVIRTLTTEQIASAKTTIQKVNEYTNTVLDKVSTPVLQTQNLKINTKKGFNWDAMLGNLFLIGFLVALFFALRSYWQRKKIQTLGQNIDPTTTKKILNIEETEALLRSKNTIDVDTHIDYLEKLNNQQNYNAFFSEFAELEKDVETYVDVNYSVGFEEYLTRNNYQTELEYYRFLKQEIEIQKYSPVPDDAVMLKILMWSKKVFPIIVK